MLHLFCTKKKAELTTAAISGCFFMQVKPKQCSQIGQKINVSDGLEIHMQVKKPLCSIFPPAEML